MNRNRRDARISRENQADKEAWECHEPKRQAEGGFFAPNYPPIMVSVDMSVYSI